MKIKNINAMKFHLVAFFLTVILNFSCSDSPRQTSQTRNEIDNNNNRPKNKPASSYSDTIKINSPSAVFFTPDFLQLEKIKAITDTMIYESMVHDCFYQMRNSRMVLKKNYPRIKTIEVKNGRYLLFEKPGGEKEYIDLDTKNDPCGIFIFDGNKKARLVDMTNIESELGFYFSK